jgi:hypothetical protein
MFNYSRFGRLKGVFSPPNALNISNRDIPKAYIGGVIDARNAQEIMHRKTVLRRGYYTQTAENNTARDSTENVPHIKYTSKVFRTGESHYILKRKVYE